MANKTEKHIHKFRRHRYSSGNTVFFCALPDCKVKIDPALSLGKRSICWRCGEPFILSEYSIRLAKPHCENCHKPKSLPAEFTGYDSENVNPEMIVRAPIPLPIEPLSGQPVGDSVSSLKARLAGVLKRAADEEDGEI